MPVKCNSAAVLGVEELCPRVNQKKVVGGASPTAHGHATKPTFKEIRSRCLAEGNLYEDPDFKMPSGKWRRPHVGGASPTAHGHATKPTFKEIRSRCLAEGNLYEDPDFKMPSGKWRRPHDICDNPQFFVEGPSRFDVNQGQLGDCWLLAAIANLTLHKKLFSQVVPDDQDFDKDYAGVFHFRFWVSGRWMEVVIDDRLPTYSYGRLIFLHSSKTNEFWSALLEKAYAKLHGSYKVLHGGWPGTAMETFTGGVTERWRWYGKKAHELSKFYTDLLKAYERKSLIAAVMYGDTEGLPGNHAYSITAVKEVTVKTPDHAEKIRLLRIRNPWGIWVEWKGPWSDRSSKWSSIPKSEKEALGLTVNDDGEFWMSYEDFLKYFRIVEICHLNPDALDPEECPEGCYKKWKSSVFEGEWVKGVTSSSCRKHLESLSCNPQYTVTLTDPDEGDDENKCTMIVALLQKNGHLVTGVTTHAIGFSVYRLPDNKHVSMPVDISSNDYQCVGRCKDLTRLREATARFKLEPGTYVIVPSTFGPDQEGQFLLRVFSENAINMSEHVASDVCDADNRVQEEPADTEPTDILRTLD